MFHEILVADSSLVISGRNGSENNQKNNQHFMPHDALFIKSKHFKKLFFLSYNFSFLSRRIWSNFKSQHWTEHQTIPHEMFFYTFLCIEYCKMGRVVLPVGANRTQRLLNKNISQVNFCFLNTCSHRVLSQNHKIQENSVYLWDHSWMNP